MPISQRGVGRDHNPGAHDGAGWRAPASRAGRRSAPATSSATRPSSSRSRYHDLHATMLHLLGLDHTKLTYRFNGRDMRLTDVYGDADSADRGVTPAAIACVASRLQPEDQCWRLSSASKGGSHTRIDDRMIRLAIVAIRSSLIDREIIDLRELVVRVGELENAARVRQRTLRSRRITARTFRIGRQIDGPSVRIQGDISISIRCWKHLDWRSHHRTTVV